jgi:glycosyltransferase involved in cell wall biosynthesis
VTTEGRLVPRSPSEAARQPRILVIAYACAPGRGSEPGAGWGISRTLADCGPVTAIVADEFLPALEAWREEHPEVDMVIVGLSENRLAVRLGAIHRVPRFIQYLLWLRRAARIADDLHAVSPFDVAVHASYGTYWLPSPVPDLGIPTIWGPVGGAVATPVRLWPSLGYVGALGELLDLVVVRTIALMPSVRSTWRRVTIPVVNNVETADALPPEVRTRARVINNAPFVDIEPTPRAAVPEPFVIFPSALEPRKGPRLALEAFAHVRSDLRLVFAADGPERPALERMARSLGVADRVEFRGWIPRAEMWDLLARASVALYTGLREEGGLALVEGMLHGTPLVVLGVGGALAVAEGASDPERVRIVMPGRRAKTATRLGAAIDDIMLDYPSGDGPSFDRAAHLARYRETVRDATAEALLAVPGGWQGTSHDPQTGLS